MNIRKSIDYSELFSALDTAKRSNLPQVELYFEIGRLINSRPEKGAAVAASEYLRSAYPDEMGFSPRNVRRMRDFFSAYSGDPNLQREAMKLGWTQNVVILEADLTTEEQAWYLHAAAENSWSKLMLAENITLHSHEKKGLDKAEESCYTDAVEKPGEKINSAPACTPQPYLSQPGGGVCDEGSAEESRTDTGVTDRIYGSDQRGEKKSNLSSSREKTGGSRDFLPEQDSVEDAARALRTLQPHHRDGQGESVRCPPHLRWRLRQQNPPADGRYRPPRECCGSMVYG